MAGPRADWAHATLLSPAELEVCWQALRFGEPPWQLDLPSPGRTPQERQQVVRSVIDALRSRSLTDPTGSQPAPGLAAQLRLLADHEHLIELRMSCGELRVALGAVAANRGVVACRQGGQIGLLTVPASAVPTVLVELAGEINAGAGMGLTLPVDVFDAAVAAAGGIVGQRLADQLARRGLHPNDAQSVVQMCAGADQVGQFAVSVHAASGRLRRGERVIGWHRTPSGHYLQLRRDRQLSVGPLRRSRLLELLAELLAETSHAAA